MMANSYKLQVHVQNWWYVRLYFGSYFYNSVDVRMLGFCFLHETIAWLFRIVVWDMDFCIICPLYLCVWHFCCTETRIFAVDDCYRSLLVLLSFVLACWVNHLDIRVCCASGLWICILRHLFICSIDKIPWKSLKGCKPRVQEGYFQKICTQEGELSYIASSSFSLDNKQIRNLWSKW